MAATQIVEEPTARAPEPCTTRASRTPPPRTCASRSSPARSRPGTKVDQDEISAALGMSRVPVREALIELAQESLIDAVPRRGAFVARLERADIVDHYRIFGLIAGLAGSRAATSLTDEQLVQLRQHPRVVRRRHRPRGQGALEPRVPQDDQPGGRFASDGVGAPELCRAACPSATSSSCPQWAEISARHHARILSALEAHDAHEAQRMLEHHVAESGDLAVEILQEMGYWDRETGDPRKRASPARRRPCHRSTASASSSSVTSWPGRTRAWCSPTSAPTCSRSRILRIPTTPARWVRTSRATSRSTSSR